VLRDKVRLELGLVLREGKVVDYILVFGFGMVVGGLAVDQLWHVALRLRYRREV
jgi:hypothetical protein